MGPTIYPIHAKANFHFLYPNRRLGLHLYSPAMDSTTMMHPKIRVLACDPSLEPFFHLLGSNPTISPKKIDLISRAKNTWVD
jgi:hypothetical protein